MPNEYLDIGAVPCDEECQQVGTEGFDSAAERRECQAFINQLKRQFGEPPEGTRITVKSHPHDFGSYRSVAVVYNPDDETSVQYAYNVECNVPANWDTEALVELGRKTDCPACGCQIEKLWQFCAGCGHKLK